MLSRDFLISLFVFICFGVYTFSFNGTRQAMAAAILMLSFYYVINGRFYKFLIMVLLGTLFHKSLLVVIPFYFLLRIKYSYKLFFLLIIGGILLAFSFTNLIRFSSVINDRYATYADFQDTGGINLALGYFLTSLIFVYVRKWIHISYLREYDIYMNSYLLGSIIFVVVVLTNSYVEITRVSFYFTFTQVFIWPIIFKNVRKEFRPIVVISFVSLSLTYFYFILSEIGSLTPYYINQDV